jgi:hypothetical protein
MADRLVGPRAASAVDTRSSTDDGRHMHAVPAPTPSPAQDPRALSTSFRDQSDIAGLRAGG